MKRHLHILMLICGVLAINAVSSQAQSTAHRMRAHIPFAFNVGEKNLPAGDYTISVLNPSSDQKVLQISSADGRWRAIIKTTGVSNRANEDTKLMFHRYGDRYFFAQAQLAGDSNGLAVAKSRAERAERRALASRSNRSVVAIITE
jgi:hypothetical protein